MSNIGFDFNQMPHCCGVYEAGYFKVGNEAKWADNTCDSPEKAIDLALEMSGGQPVFFNFVRNAIVNDVDDPTGRYEDTYECAELRDAVMKHPKAHHLGCFVNKNSENIVDSWYIFDKEDASEL